MSASKPGNNWNTPNAVSLRGSCEKTLDLSVGYDIIELNFGDVHGNEKKGEKMKKMTEIEKVGMNIDFHNPCQNWLNP